MYDNRCKSRSGQTNLFRTGLLTVGYKVAVKLNLDSFSADALKMTPSWRVGHTG